MHVIIASILVALAVSAVLLVAFWLFTLTSFARRLGGTRERSRPRDHPRLS